MKMLVMLTVHFKKLTLTSSIGTETIGSLRSKHSKRSTPLKQIEMGSKKRRQGQQQSPILFEAFPFFAN